MPSQRMTRRHEKPIRRTYPSGRVAWMARWTEQQGARHKAGTFDLKGPCRNPVERSWLGETWSGCCAQHAIDAAYDREAAPRPVRMDTLGAYAELWTKVYPRAKRTNDENKWRIGVVLAMELDELPKVALRDWPLSDVRRRHALAVQAKLLEQRRSAAGATGILRAMSAMANDAIDDEVCDTNPWLRLGVELNDPRVTQAPRPKRIWTMEQMHAFAAAAATVRDEGPRRDDRA